MFSTMAPYVELADQWWEGTNTEPVYYAIYPAPEVDFAPVLKPWMSPKAVSEWSAWQQELLIGQAVELVQQTGDYRYVEEAIDLLEYHASVTGHTGGGFSFLLPGFGPGMVSALLSNYAHFTDTTVWFELEHPWDWPQLLAIDPRQLTPYAEIVRETLRRLVARLHGVYLFAPPDLGGVLDIIAGLRGTQNLLLDLFDYPEQVLTVSARVEEIWYAAYQQYSRIIDPVNDGLFTHCFRYLSSKPYNVAVCDFSAMISPEMFEEFVRPSLQQQARYFHGRLAYHLDGPGEIPHVPILGAIDGLHAIQWVPGAGNPDNLDPHWFPLYRQILDQGQKICLAGIGYDPDRLRALYQTFPAHYFLVPVTTETKQQAEEMVAIT